MELDGQQRAEPLDVSGRPLVPSRVAETRPTPLQDWFIYLSVIVLVCGTIAISALELGGQVTDPVIRIPLMIGGIVLATVTADATVRVWRSAWAWLPVDRGRGLFRFVWSAVLAVALAATATMVVLVLLAN